MKALRKIVLSGLCLEERDGRPARSIGESYFDDGSRGVIQHHENGYRQLHNRGMRVYKTSNSRSCGGLRAIRAVRRFGAKASGSVVD